MTAALLAFLGFAVLVILHELGHFAAAKAVGMRVERFALFFPPIIAKIKRGETEYAIGSIPLGGYVKITGMNPDEELEPELRARSYAGSPVWKRVVVIAAGPFVNLVIAFVLLTAIFWSEGKPAPAGSPATIAVGAVQTGAPADGVLREGDRILRVGDAAGYAPNLTSTEVSARIKGLMKEIAGAGCATTESCTTAKAVQLTILRDGQQQTVSLTPRYDAQEKRALVGIGFGSRVSIGPLDASSAAITGMGRVTKQTVTALTKIVYDKQARKDVSSVVGGYEATRQSFEVDTIQAIQILALISLSLAIINLFPFLPLDGGHILWALVEKLRGGRRVSTVTLERASVIGFALVLMLFAVGLSNDIGRITSGEGFGIR